MSFEGLPTDHRDALTNLPNLLAIRAALDKEIATRPGKFALLELDVDGFKIVNDQLGHNIGDMVLQRVADTLSSNLRQEDQCLPARRSGDEFSIIIGGVRTTDQVTAVCERIRTLLTTAIRVPLVGDLDKELDIGVSIGGRVHQIGESAERLRIAADELMREDKIQRKIERNDNPQIREAIRDMARRAIELGIATRDLPALIDLHLQGRF